MIRHALAVALVVAVASSSYAEQLAITNWSFEDPTLDVGGWTNTLADWDGPDAAGDSFIEYIDTFSSDGNNHIGIQNGEEVSQDLGVSVLPNTIYNLILGVGRRNDGFSPAGNESRYGLYVGGDAGAGGTLLVDDFLDASTIGTDLTFVERSISFTTGATVPSGNLFLSLRTTGAGRAHFDGISLEAIPEPSALALVLVGLLGLVHRARRR